MKEEWRPIPPCPGYEASIMIDLNLIPLNDPAAFKILNDGKTCGIFQFQGKALQTLCQQMTIESLDDLIAITALARPGPSDAGSTEHWIKRRTGKEEISYRHILLEPILKSTLGVITFQEQCMRIGREIGGLSWEDVNALRKAIGKSQGVETFGSFGDKWKIGALAKGIDQRVADQIWNELVTFGRYGFVKAHATAYSIISYQCCWLKAHYLLEFCCSVLDSEPDPDKQIALLRELAAEGVTYVPVDPEHSTDRWSIAVKDGKRTLVGPITSIKGIGPVSVLTIMEARKNGQSISDRLIKKLTDAQTKIDTLFPIQAAIKKICPDLGEKKIVTIPTPIVGLNTGQEAMIIGVVKKIEQIDENTPERVARRQGRSVFPSEALNVFLQDDSGELFCKVNNKNFDVIGRQILESVVAKKSIYAFKGCIDQFMMDSYNFKMFRIESARYVGDIS